MTIKKMNAISSILECSRHKYHQIINFAVVYNKNRGKKETAESKTNLEIRDHFSLA